MDRSSQSRRWGLRRTSTGRWNRWGQMVIQPIGRAIAGRTECHRSGRDAPRAGARDHRRHATGRSTITGITDDSARARLLCRRAGTAGDQEDGEPGRRHGRTLVLGTVRWPIRWASFINDPLRLHPTAARPGIVTHHIAFRCTDEEQLAWQDHIRSRNIHVTEVLDRSYFKSICFPSPDGCLKIATRDRPGLCGRRARRPAWGTHLAPIGSSPEERDRRRAQSGDGGVVTVTRGVLNIRSTR